MNKERLNTSLNERIKVKKSETIFSENPPFPQKNLLVEVNNACNHKCIFCSNRKMTRKKGFVDGEFLKRVLKEAYDNGTREVGYYATGEPFLNPDLVSHVRAAKEIGFEYIYITTNGAFATIDKVKKCIDAGLDSLKFSVNGYDQKTYAFVHGVDDFHTVMENIKAVSNYKKENNLNFNLFSSSILTIETYENKEKFKELLGDLVDEQFFLEVMNQGGLISDLISKLAVPNTNTNMKNCTMPFHALNITWEGYLTACCTDFNNYLAVADLNKVSLLEAWNCEPMVALRHKLLTNETEGTMCHSCYYSCTDGFSPLNKDLYHELDFTKVYHDDELEKRKAILS